MNGFRIGSLCIVIALACAPAAAQPKGKKGKKGKAETPTEEPAQLHEFRDNESGKPGLAHGVTRSKIKPTKTQAALKLTVVDQDKGPIDGLVMKLTGPDGQQYFTEESDAKGYAEVLVPVGQTYELEYLSLGRKKIAAKVPVDDEPNQTIKLTLRYKRNADPESKTITRYIGPKFKLEGVEFDTGKATLRQSSYPRLNHVVEYMTHKKSSRIEISGHTDNVGKPAANKRLSQARAEACKNYIVSQGIDASRIEAVGFGEERPVASNSTPEGRQRNRRIEAAEL
jgi:outer membrane protein OmpA-like peptidoglycan-associated protein